MANKVDTSIYPKLAQHFFVWKMSGKLSHNGRKGLKTETQTVVDYNVFCEKCHWKVV